jgi:hypothetical protein
MSREVKHLNSTLQLVAAHQTTAHRHHGFQSAGSILRGLPGDLVVSKQKLRQTDESLDALIEVITAELSLGTDGCFTERFQPRWATALIDAVAARGSERDSSSHI